MASQSLPADELDFARSLHLWSRPIFAVPQTKFRDDWRGWKHLTAADNAANIRGRRPTDALAAGMGGRLCGIDVDPDRGGSYKAAERLLDGLQAAVLAEVTSGSGVGVHWYILKGVAPLPSRKDHDLTGVELKAEGTCLFIPGGAARAKHWGGRYSVRWSVLDIVSRTQDVDDSALRAWAGKGMAKPVQEPLSAPESVPRGGPVDLQSTGIRDPLRYGMGAVANVERYISEAPAGGRHYVISRRSYDLGCTLAALGWNSAALADVESRLIHAATNAGHRPTEARTSFRNGLLNPTMPRAGMRY